MLKFSQCLGKKYTLATPLDGHREQLAAGGGELLLGLVVFNCLLNFLEGVVVTYCDMYDTYHSMYMYMYNKKVV